MKYLRIKRKKDFTKLLKSGKRAHAGSLTLVYLPAKQTSFAVCVGKKYGKSTQRNRIKRLLREAFRTQGELKPTAFLMIPRVSEEYSYAVFEKDLRYLLKKESLFETQSSKTSVTQSSIPAPTETV